MFSPGLSRHLAYPVTTPLTEHTGAAHETPGNRTGAVPDTVYTSRSFSPDIVGGSAITVTGGSISIDGGAFGTAGFAWVEDSIVQLRGTSPADYSTLETEEITEVVLLVGGVATYTFTITNSVDPALLNTVTFGGESVTFDGDTTVTLGA